MKSAQLEYEYGMIPDSDRAQRVFFLAKALDDDVPFALRRLRGVATELKTNLTSISDELLVPADERLLIEEHLTDVYFGSNESRMIEILCKMAEKAQQARTNVTIALESYIAEDRQALGNRMMRLCDMLSASMQAPFTKKEKKLAINFARAELIEIADWLI